MKSLGRYVLGMHCNMGRLRFEDDGTLTLLDCSEWNWDHSNRLSVRFPDVHVTMRSSRESLSGFVVIFSKKQDSLATLWLLLIGLLLAAVVYAGNCLVFRYTLEPNS